MIVTNTFFDLPPRRLYTWKSPLDTPEHVVRNQIDFILVNKRFRNTITSVKTYPGADINSDHNPLIATMHLKLKKINRTKQPMYDLRQLKNEQTRQETQEYINSKIPTQMQNLEEDLKRLQEINKEILDRHLRRKRVKRKQWITEEILDMMEERREMKDKDKIKYKQIDKAIKGAIRQAKDQWFREQCEEIEQLDKKYDSFNLHKKVKQMAGLYKHKQGGCLTDNEGNIVLDTEHKKELWTWYIRNSFRDERNMAQLNLQCSDGLAITQDEVRHAIKKTKDGKATGPDDFHSEFLKLMSEDGVKWITSIFNKIYNSGEIPRDWLKSTFITIPKKANPKKCDEYRIISLMSHLLKTFLKVIHQRIYNKVEAQLTRTQFGFRDAQGTREALFAVQVLFQRCRDVNCDVYMCFIDYSKAFDNVKHDKLMSILRSIGLHDQDIRIIHHLYYNQTANVRVGKELTEEVTIQRGVRQGCILSPVLFNLYSEEIMKMALEDNEIGILINGERLNNIRYADDTVIFADSLEGLQTLVTRTAECSQQYGLEFNVNKTKYMIISKTHIPYTQLTVNQQHIERVSSYKYLGTNINDQWDHSAEIKIRIERARSSFIKMKRVFKSRDLPIATKLRLLRCYVFSILLYGVESWTLTKASMNKLEALEMWCYRRILNISWMDRITNVEVLRRLNYEKCEINDKIKQKKLEYLGHIMRNGNRYGLLQLILQGKIYGHRGPGRRRNSWLQNLRQWFSLTTTELFRAAANKVRIAMLVANIRTG